MQLLLQARNLRNNKVWALLLCKGPGAKAFETRRRVDTGQSGLCYFCWSVQVDGVTEFFYRKVA